MLPDVVLGAGKWADDVSIALLGAISSGKLKITEKVQPRLQPLASFVSKKLKKSMTKAVKYQGKPGISWRSRQGYYDVRIQTGIFLDLAGLIDDEKLIIQLREALSYSDPRLVAFAALSLLRLGEQVSNEILEIPAASHESRNLLYEGLKDLKCEKMFPKKWKTWDAFAASNMVEWLRMPNELGREPDELEKNGGPDRRYRKKATFIVCLEIQEPKRKA
jgi:hypothetical protein